MLSSAQIAGPSVGFVGKSLTFNADLGQDAPSSSPSYQWNLLNQYGSPYTPPGGLPSETLSSVVLPGTLPAGSYALTLAVSESGSPTQNATFPLEVLSDPQDNLLYGTVPAVTGSPEGFASAMVRQADGKIVVAGYWGDPTGDVVATNIWNGWWIARFNPDLSLDTSFQNHHGGTPGYISSQGVPGYFASIQRLAINPTNQDIIVVGTGFQESIYTLQVAELVPKETVEADGAVVAPGSFDPNFNSGNPFYYAPPPPAGSSGSVVSCGEGVDVLPDGDLLVGGGSEVFTGVVGEAGSAGSNSDFLLLAITPDGTLDPNFNGSGVAQQPDVSGTYDANGTTLYPSSRIFSLTVDGQGNIYAGGVGSPSAGSSYQSDSEGIVLVRYSSSGVIDTNFGSDGQAYTDSSAFNGSSGGSAFLSSMELLPSGNILMVGQANMAVPDPYTDSGTFPTAINAHVILAEYDSGSGALATSYASGGIANTSIHFNGLLSPNTEADATSPYVFGTGWFPQNLGSFVFQSDASIVGSLATDSGWQFVRFAGSNALAGETAALTIPVNSATADWSFYPNDNPGILVATDDSIISAGTVMGFNQASRSAPYNGGGQFQAGGSTFSQPLVVRYLLQSPAVGDLTTGQSSTGKLALSWDVTLPGQTGFEIERSTAVSGDGSTLTSPQLLAQVGPTQSDYVDSTAVASTQYYYQVVPVYTSSGTQESGQASNVAGIYTADPAATTNVFQEAVQIPLTGGPVSTATTLQAGHDYLIETSGLFHLNSGVLGDPAYWYSAADPQNLMGSQLSVANPSMPADASQQNYGVAVGTTGAMAIPAWGISDADHHSYFYVVEGTGTNLSFALQGVANFASTADIASGDRPLEVEIYEMNGTAAPPPPPAQTTAGVMTLELSVPNIGAGTVLPVLSAPSPIDVLAAASDSSAVPWQLYAEPATGGAILLAQGDSSSGTLPGSPADVMTLDPSSFPDEIYTLLLRTNYPPASPNSPPPPPAVEVSYQLVMAKPVMQITSPATAPDGVTPVVGSSTPVDVLSANPDGGENPWSLYLVSDTNSTDALLASSADSVGTLPGFGSTVATLDASLHPNGTYELELKNADGGVMDSRTVTIATAVKKGTLQLPVTDAVVNTASGPVTVSRTYDSGLVNVPAPQDPTGARPIAPNLGPGWSFSLLDSRLSTSAEADTVNANSSMPVLRAGDLVYLTVPDGGQHVFEFDPIPLEEPTTFAGSQSSIAYQANFVPIDGSGATLSFNFREFFAYFHQTSNNLSSTVYYDPADNEFGYPGAQFSVIGPYYASDGAVDDTHFIGFNPAAAQRYPGGFAGYGYDLTAWDPYDLGGGTYQLTNKDGTSYTIDAGTGAIESVKDQNGNTTTYNYDPADNKVTAVSSLGATLFTVLTNSSNVVTSIQVPGQNAINYGYTGGNLTSVENQASQTTSYAYTDSSFPHFLTGITNPQGQTILRAQYNSAGMLDALVNVQGVTMPVSYGQIGNDGVAQTVVDAAGETTEDFFNEQYGTLIRKIQTQTDGSGNVTDYIVSLANFNYVNNDVGQISALRSSGEEVLQSVQNFAPFEVQGSDPTGQRFVEQPGGNDWVSQTTYNTVGDGSDPAYQQILSTSQRITDAGALKTTLYSDYSIVNATTGQAKPLLTTVEIQTPAAAQPTGYLNEVQSQTYSQYDSAGQVLYSLVAAGREFGSSQDPELGVYSDVMEGDFPSVLYATLSGFSNSADGTWQTLRWTPVADSYNWGDGSGISVVLQDTTMPTRGAGGTPLDGDDWTLTVTDGGASSGHGVTGQLANLSFDGSPLGLSNLLAAFFAAETFTDNSTSLPVADNAGLGMAVTDWIGTGTEYSYTSPGGSSGSTLVSETDSIVADIAADGTISVTQNLGAQSLNTYYTADDYTQDPDSGAWIPNAGASYGQVKYSFNAAGQETYFAYNAAGQRVLQYVYKQWTDSSGNLVNGWAGTTTVYDSAGRQTDSYQATYLDPTADTSENIAFQAKILPVISDGEDGIEIDTNSSDSSYVTVYAAPVDTQHTDYTTLGQVADTIDQYGGETTNTYDASGNKIETLYPNGTEMLSVFDSLNRAIWTTNQFYPGGSNAPVLTHTIYNQLKQNLETDTFDGGTITISSTTVGGSTIYSASISTSTVGGVLTPTGGTFVSSSKMFYDAAGHEIETIAPSGLRTGSIYTPDGTVLETGPLKAAAPDGGSSTTTYEGVTSNEFVLSNLEVDSSTKYTITHDDQYNAVLGLFNKTTDQDGHTTVTYADALGRSVRTAYADGSFTETLYGVGSNPVTFDQEGDTIPTPSNWQGIPAGGSETVSIAERQDGDLLVLTYDIYDASNNLVAVYQPAVADGNPDSETYGETVNPLTTYGYDVAGNEISQTDADGNVTTFGYDQNGNQVLEKLPDSESESWTYNLQNQVTGSIDLDGNTATYSYATSGDEAGLLQSVVCVGATGSGKATQTVTYTYNDLGQQATVTDASGTTTSSYDDFGNLTESQTPEGTIWYVFDPATQNHTETYTANTETYYGYDIQGRLTTITIDELNGTTLTDPLVTTYGYDPVGNKKSETDPNGDVIAYSYDALNRLTGETITDGSTTLFDEQFTLNDNGTRASADESQLQPDGSTVTSATDWTYDDLQRLTGEAYASSVTSDDYSDVYTYDLASNRMTSVHTGPGGGTDETTSYTYTGDNELWTQTSSLSGTTTNSYDPNGSLTSGSTGGVVTATYTYDVRNKMVGYSSGSTTSSYVYDDSGNRVEETLNGTATYYLTDTQNPTGYAQPLEAKASKTAVPSMTYFLGDRVIAQADASGTVTVLLPDGHGSTEQLANSSGTVTAAFQYDAFGTAVNFTPASAGTVFLFGGDAVYDPASGTYFHGDGIRQTDGFLFIQRDTYAGNTQDPRSLHKYLYANGNPVSESDPSGHAGEEQLIGGGSDMNAYADDAAIGEGAMGQAEGVVAEEEGGQLGDLAIESWENEGGSLGADSEVESTFQRDLSPVDGGPGVNTLTGWLQVQGNAATVMLNYISGTMGSFLQVINGLRAAAGAAGAASLELQAMNANDPLFQILMRRYEYTCEFGLYTFKIPM